MLGGRRSDNGSLFVTTTPPINPQFIGGVLVGENGGLYVTPTLPAQVAANGFGLRHDGALCVAYGGAIDKFEMGLPFTSDGKLVCQLNQAVQPSDPFVGGIRVGPLGGVYVVDLTPPPILGGFGSGFSGGFE